MIFLVTFAFLRLVDLGTTYYVIEHLGGYEANPIAATIIGQWHLVAILLAAFCGCITWLYLKFPGKAWWALNGINAIGPVNNIWVLANAGS